MLRACCCNVLFVVVVVVGLSLLRCELLSVSLLCGVVVCGRGCIVVRCSWLVVYFVGVCGMVRLLWCDAVVCYCGALLFVVFCLLFVVVAVCCVLYVICCLLYVCGCLFVARFWLLRGAGGVALVVRGLLLCVVVGVVVLCGFVRCCFVVAVLFVVVCGSLLTLLCVAAVWVGAVVYCCCWRCLLLLWSVGVVGSC